MELSHLPELKIRELREDFALFEVKNTTPYFVNAIRRILLTEVPKYAVSKVRVYCNDTPLFDEYIVHRLAMIPFKTPVEQFFDKEGNLKMPEDLEENTILFSLAVENKGEEVKLITSRDMMPLTKTTDVLPVYSDVPIAELLPNQKLELEIFVSPGFGKQHAKWEVAVAPGFKPYPEVKIEGCKYPKECPDAPCSEVCPQKIFKKEKEKIEIVNVDKCRLCRDCIDVCPHQAIQVEWDESHYIFHFETDGSMKAIEALWAASNVWSWKLKTFKEKFEEFCSELEKS